MKIQPFNWVPDDSTVALIAGASPYLQAKANDKVELIWKLFSFSTQHFICQRWLNVGLKKQGFLFASQGFFKNCERIATLANNQSVCRCCECVWGLHSTHTPSTWCYLPSWICNIRCSCSCVQAMGGLRSCEEFQSTSPRCYFHRATLEFNGRCALIVLQGSTFVFPC